MHKDIFQYTCLCEVCQSQKPDDDSRMSPRKVSHPWEVVCTDLIGPLPVSYAGNRYVLVVIDLFTKYYLLVLLKKATSSAVVKRMENDVFMIYGVSERLICDNGRQYISNSFRKMISSYECKIVYSAQ